MSLRLLLVIAYTLLLAVLATAPPIPLPVQGSVPLLKWHHIGAFAVYVILLGALFERAPRLRLWTRYLLTATIAFAFGAIIELVQTQLAHRSGQWVDLIPNLMGIAGGLLALAGWEYLLRGLRKRRKRRNQRAQLDAEQDADTLADVDATQYDATSRSSRKMP